MRELEEALERDRASKERADEAQAAMEEAKKEAEAARTVVETERKIAEHKMEEGRIAAIEAQNIYKKEIDAEAGLTKAAQEMYNDVIARVEAARVEYKALETEAL